MHTSAGSHQSPASIAANAGYFLNNLKSYQSHVRDIDTYRTIHRYISEKVAGTGNLLDVGNGGVFAYDTAQVGAITAIDLFFDDLPAELVRRHFPPNARAQSGSALAVPAADRSFDMVVMVMLLHHLSGEDWRSSWSNAQRAIAEGWRVLAPGGRMLIVESCIPEWFFPFEKVAFRLLSRATKTILSHPITLQFPVRMIAEELGTRAASLVLQPIPKGRYVLQFGKKVPSVLTPVQVYGIEARKA